MDLIAEDSFWLTICALGSSIVIALLGIVPIILTPLYFSSSLKSFNASPATISSISSTHNRSQRHPSSNKSHPQSTRPNRSVSGHRAKLNRSGDIPNGTISSASSPDAVSTTLTSADNFGFIDLQKSMTHLGYSIYFSLPNNIFFYLFLLLGKPMQRLLGFSAGSLIVELFIHLLPEIWKSMPIMIYTLYFTIINFSYSYKLCDY